MSRATVIFTVFFAHALAGGSIFTRIPDIQFRLGLEESVLGLALTLAAVGGLLSNLVAGRVVGRFGPKLVLATGIPLLALFSAAVAMAPNLPSLFGALLLMGISFTLANVAMNVEADRIEADGGRRVMNRCHGIWSGGMLLASLIGVGARALAIPAAVHLAAVVPIILALAFFVIARLDAAPPTPGDRTDRPGVAIPSRRTLLLTLFGLAGGMAQGGTQNWSVIFMRDTFTAADWIDTLSLPAFLVAMTLGRMVADAWTERRGPVRVARGLVLVALAGAFSVSLAPFPAVALLGFALMGLGTAVMFPLMISAAARSGTRPPAEAVSAVILVLGLAMMVTPAVMGWIAEIWGLRAVFLFLVPPMAMSLVLANQLGRGPTAP